MIPMQWKILFFLLAAPVALVSVRLQDSVPFSNSMTTAASGNLRSPSVLNCSLKFSPVIDIGVSPCLMSLAHFFSIIFSVFLCASLYFIDMFELGRPNSGSMLFWVLGTLYLCMVPAFLSILRCPLIVGGPHFFRIGFLPPYCNFSAMFFIGQTPCFVIGVFGRPLFVGKNALRHGDVLYRCVGRVSAATLPGHFLSHVAIGVN